MSPPAPLSLSSVLLVAMLVNGVAYGVTQTEIPSTTQWKSAEELGMLNHVKWAQPRESYFDRFPLAAKSVVRDAVWGLSKDPAGQSVLFETDSPHIYVNYTLTSGDMSMWNMPASGRSGCDIYMYTPHEKKWRWAGTLHEGLQFPLAAGLVVQNTRVPGVQTYLVNLPTYNGVVRFSVGVEAGRRLAPASHSPFAGKKPVVWYGTSIAQGAASSRPGSIFTNQLTRMLGREVLNFGFSGNGLMETSVLEFITQVDAALFVIDCLPNMTGQQVGARTVPLVKYIRARHPHVPIVLSEGTGFYDGWVNAEKGLLAEQRRANLTAQFDLLVAMGTPNIHLVRAADLLPVAELGDTNPTVGGVHPTDLGFFFISRFYAHFLPSILP